MEKKERAENNRTLTLKPEEIDIFRKRLVTENNIQGCSLMAIF